MQLVAPPLVTVKEEYVIYDAVAMISAIGGTMGLCIGFSFSDISSLLIRCIEIRCLKGSANKISLVNQDQAHSGGDVLLHITDEAPTPQNPIDPRIMILITKLQCQLDKIESELLDLKALNRN